MNESDIDFSRGAEDIVFISTDVDMEELAELEDAREELQKRMLKRNLKWENARLMGLFSGEFVLELEEGAKIKLDGKQIYPKKE